MEKREYRSAVRSRRLIREAFLDLLREKPYEKITVTDIVRRADINRSTFYAHYQDIWALVEECQREIVDHTLAVTRQLQYSSIFRDPMTFLQAISGPLEQNKELYRLLSRTNHAPQQMAAIRQDFVQYVLASPELPEALRRSPEFRIRVEFFMGGVFDTYQRWIDGMLDCPIELVSQQIAAVIRSSAQDILRVEQTSEPPAPQQ